MKTGSCIYNIIRFYIGIFIVTALFACYDEYSNFDDNHRVEEGIPVNVNLQFKAQDNVVVSRVGRDPVYENKVDNVYLFIFDSNGNVHKRKFCTPGNGLSYDGQSTDKGYLYIETSSLNNASIFGIANVSVDGVTATAYTVTEADLNAINSREELENMVIRMSDNSVERYAIFMMTGLAVDESGNSVVTIPGTESGASTLDCRLELSRTDAKIKFVVSTDPSDPDLIDFSFSPKTWVVKRVPSQSYLLPQANGDYSENDAAYFTSVERSFEEITRDENNPKLSSGGSFVYYMPENRKSPKKDIEIQGAEGYALREKWSVEDDLGDKVFDYANDVSTYVEITGLLSYYNSDGKNTNADVRFIVHLGNPDENGTGVYDVNNYNTNRNTFYTYNIKIRGVNDIKVEVEEDNEIRPGYEGDVVLTEKTAYTFDSHYDRCLIKINPANFASDGKVYWSINTPFSRGVYEIPLNGSVEVPEDLRDYRWVKFAVNREYGEPEDAFVKYPGDQNYNDPYPLEGLVEGVDYNAPSPYYAEKGKGDARLMDVNQFMMYIREMHDKGINEDITVSVFVDEHLYFKDPITGEEGNDHRSLWKLTSDKQDRILYLVIERPEYSSDGNSSISVAEYSFRQRTIRTIFNVDKPELTTAWGLESVMETDRLAPGNVSSGSDTRNGRANCLKWLVGKKWTDIVNVRGEQYELKEGYNDAAFACLLRNRDLNGDNVVDANEVRWYLASIDQLTDIFLGEYALDEQSRLYPTNASDRDNMLRWHYTSSSYNGEDKNAWVLWAEEGASRGSFKDSNSNMGGKFNYRCVRNLGISLDNPEEVPTDLISVTEDFANPGYYLIDASNMNIKSRRTSYVTVLPNHNERSDINRPYEKFRVHKDCYGGDGKTPFVDSWGINPSWNDWPWNHYQTFMGYPQGYRIPNQRELLIMTTRMPGEAWKTFTENHWFYGTKSIRPNYICQTAFSLNGHSPEYNNAREGFLWNSSNGVFFLQNNRDEEGYVRPVQDVH